MPKDSPKTGVAARKATKVEYARSSNMRTKQCNQNNHASQKTSVCKLTCTFLLNCRINYAMLSKRGGRVGDYDEG